MADAGANAALTAEQQRAYAVWLEEVGRAVIKEVRTLDGRVVAKTVVVCRACAAVVAEGNVKPKHACPHCSAPPDFTLKLLDEHGVVSGP